MSEFNVLSGRNLILGLAFFASLAAFIFFSLSCSRGNDETKLSDDKVPAQSNKYESARAKMIKEQIISRGVKDQKVLDAMQKVQRHLFVSERYRSRAYGDHPLPIGEDQTISQPYIVAFMTELAELNEDDRVLEIGTGSGYQGAILAEIVKEVYTIEIVEPLGIKAKKLFDELEYKNITCKIGDGYQGWEEHQPFDAILVTAAPDHVPQPLIDQLAEGGRMVIPVGDQSQELLLLQKIDGEVKAQKKLPVRFVPMTGEAENY